MNGKENIVNIDVLLMLLVQRSDFRNAKSCGLKLHAYEIYCKEITRLEQEKKEAILFLLGFSNFSI